MASISAVEAVEPSSAIMESPNWLDMPHELMVSILERLSTSEKLRDAWNVCRTWRRIVKDPVMWKDIDINTWMYDYRRNYNPEMLIKKAVDLSCGELTDVSICGYGTNDLLDYIVQRSCKLKHLNICCCEAIRRKAITGRALSRAVKRLPQLEKLYLDNISINNGDTEAIGRNCPQLKSFIANFWSVRQAVEWDDHAVECDDHAVECDDCAVSIANSMPNLRLLKIFGSKMTNVGLQGILNGCPHLEYLEIGMSYSLILDGNLVNKCMERIKNFIYNSSQTAVTFNESSEQDD